MNSLEDSVWWPRAQKSLPLRTLCTSPCRVGVMVGMWVVDGIGVGVGVGKAVSTHPELWKYSLVGTERTAAPSVPQ